jgi:phosphatidylglycerol:prolipoprotein diacylglycerol transferase
MLYLGLVTGVIAENAAAHAIGVAPLRVFVATLILIPPAILGSRLLYVASHLSRYRGRPNYIFRSGEGGLAMYGGLPVMLLFSVPLLKVMDVTFGSFWDAASFTILAGISLTKIGCLLHGCCAGRCSQRMFAIFLPDANGTWGKRIPVQLLEAGWAAILFGAAWVVLRRIPFHGALFLGVAALYAIGRLLLETFRERDHALSQIAGGKMFSMLTATSALAALIVFWPK